MVERTDGEVWAEVFSEGDELTDPVPKHADFHPEPSGGHLRPDLSPAVGAALMTFNVAVRAALDSRTRLSRLSVRVAVEPGIGPSAWVLDTAIEVSGGGTATELEHLAFAAAWSRETVEKLSRDRTVSIRSVTVRVLSA